jgi:Zn finger protein HypA/HybF involved in hydrogenase expression
MTDIELLRPKCYCYNCLDNKIRMTRMILCPDCGNKRCPRATDHNNACTNSNEPGQEGSRY